MAVHHTAIKRPYGYFTGMEHWLARARDFICPLAPIIRRVPAGAIHLDIGCGRGVLLGAVTAERHTQSSGCEISAPAVAAARRSLEGLASRVGCSAPTVVHASNSNLWPAGPFEVVTIVDVLHHVASAQQTEFLVAAAHRVRAGGVLIFKDIALYPRWKRVMNTLHDLVIARQLIHYMPLAEVIAILSREGLELMDVERYSVLWYAHELALLRRPA